MKSDESFEFEHAAWPALLVDGAGAVVRANLSARSLFGSALAGGSATLAAFWPDDNGLTAERFLQDAGTVLAPLTPVRLLVKGVPTVFAALVTAFPRDGKRCSLLQLLPESAATAAAKIAADTGLAHKQKLDCALQLARSVALDFNNALTSILGYTSLLLIKTEATHPWRHTLLEMEKSAARAAEVAADLAAFSLQEKETRTRPAGNLNALLHRCVESFQKSRAKPTAWTLQLEQKLFAAKFEEAKIQQAFVRLLENAVESLREDGRVTVQTRNLELTEARQDHNAKLAPGAYVCVEVADNGCGIEPAVMPRIFEPFFTTKAGAHRGLGLAWVYGIVTNHGGGVAVSSQPGAGTSVRIYLPAENSFVRESEAATADLTGSQTILMVDDEDLLLQMGETILSTYGYRVLTANSGQKALEIISQSETPVALVITDLVMPLMSGRELVEQIRRLSPGTRLLCASGYVWPGSKEDNASFLQKPFTTQELLRRVKQTLEAPPTS